MKKILKNINEHIGIVFANVYEFVLGNVEEKMREIYKYVSKHDGIGSEYRHMFVNRNEVK